MMNGAGAGTNYPLTAAQGQYTLSGQSATLTATHGPLVAAQGSYTLTGQDAGLSWAQPNKSTYGTSSPLVFMFLGGATGVGVAKSITAEAGYYTYTGAISYSDFAITAASGTYTLTGQAALSAFTRRLAAGQGSYTLTGQAAGLTVLSDRKLTAEQGAYTLSGQDAALSRTRSLAADRGTYTLTGQSANLVAPARAVVTDATGGWFTDSEIAIIRANQARRKREDARERAEAVRDNAETVRKAVRRQTNIAAFAAPDAEREIRAELNKYRVAFDEVYSVVVSQEIAAMRREHALQQQMVAMEADFAFLLAAALSAVSD